MDQAFTSEVSNVLIRNGLQKVNYDNMFNDVVSEYIFKNNKDNSDKFNLAYSFNDEYTLSSGKLKKENLLSGKEIFLDHLEKLNISYKSVVYKQFDEKLIEIQSMNLINSEMIKLVDHKNAVHLLKQLKKDRKILVDGLRSAEGLGLKEMSLDLFPNYEENLDNEIFQHMLSKYRTTIYGSENIKKEIENIDQEIALLEILLNEKLKVDFEKDKYTFFEKILISDEQNESLKTIDHYEQKLNIFKKIESFEYIQYAANIIRDNPNLTLLSYNIYRIETELVNSQLRAYLLPLLFIFSFIGCSIILIFKDIFQNRAV